MFCVSLHLKWVQYDYLGMQINVVIYHADDVANLYGTKTSKPYVISLEYMDKLI